jgi:ABC-2 type transport system permease protein
MFGIFIGGQLDLLRDKATLFIVVLFPTILVFILGTLLGNLDNPDRTVEPFRLAYVMDSDDPATGAVAQAIIDRFDEVEQVEFIELDEVASAERQLAQGELGAVVVFTEPFGIEIHEGGDSAQNRVVRAIFEGVARLHASTTVAGAALREAAQTGDAQGTTPPATTAAPPAGAQAPAGEPGTAAPATTTPPPSSFDPTAPTTTDTSAAPPRVEEATYGVTRTMMDYYAVTMIVMMFFMGSASAGAATFYQMRRDGTLRRVLASPLNRTSVYLQLLLSQFPMNIVQVGIVMVVSSGLFGAHYALTWQLNVLLFVALAVAGFAFSSLFLLLGMFLRVNPLVAIIPLMWVVLFLSGTFSKEIFVEGLTPLMPPWLIQNAAFDLTLFGRTGQMTVVLVVSLALIAASTLVGNLIFRRKEVAS